MTSNLDVTVALDSGTGTTTFTTTRELTVSNVRADIPGIGTKKSRVRQHPGIPNVTAPQGGHGVSAYRPPEARLTGLRTLPGTLAVLLLSAVTWNHLSGTASMNRG
jgi:hypothetical protein